MKTHERKAISDLIDAAMKQCSLHWAPDSWRQNCEHCKANAAIQNGARTWLYQMLRELESVEAEKRALKDQILRVVAERDEARGQSADQLTMMADNITITPVVEAQAEWNIEGRVATVVPVCRELLIDDGGPQVNLWVGSTYTSYRGTKILFNHQSPLPAEAAVTIEPIPSPKRDLVEYAKKILAEWEEKS